MQFGQLFWFKNYHPEDVPSAKERYAQQVVRVFAVLDSVLKDKKYLLGGDDAYVNSLLPSSLPEPAAPFCFW